MRSKLIAKWVLRVLLFQLILINISAACHAHRITHYYNSDSVRNIKPSAGKIFLRTWRLMVGRKYGKSLISYYPSTPYDTVWFTTKKGIRIEAWSLKADSAAGTVILFHGLSSNKGNILPEAYTFLMMGYNALVVDMRAHGNSEGIANSLGVRETEEVKLAYDHVAATGEKNIVLWGASLGAVIITKAIHDYGITPSKLILEAPFNRLQDHVKARARVLGFPDEPFGFFVTLWAGIEQGYWGFGHKTEKYVRKITCPVLLQWGVNDQYVLKKETDRIFDRMGSTQKKLVIYQQSGHESFVRREMAKWDKTVSDFLNN